MESHGTPGEIQVTASTRELLEDEFELAPRGTVTIKGKGAIETWYLIGRKTAAAAREPIGGMVAAEREEAAAG
jgi:class 3 adenylate cyclase